MPRSFHTSCIISAVKWVPRSELTLKGSPNLEKIWFNNRQAVVSAVSLGAGRHSIHFVNSQTNGEEVFVAPASTVVGVLPSLFGGVRPWEDHSFPLQWCSWFGFAGWNWQHTRHPLTYSATSCCMPGQYATCLSVS